MHSELGAGKYVCVGKSYSNAKLWILIWRLFASCGECIEWVMLSCCTRVHVIFMPDVMLSGPKRRERVSICEDIDGIQRGGCWFWSELHPVAELSNFSLHCPSHSVVSLSLIGWLDNNDHSLNWHHLQINCYSLFCLTLRKNNQCNLGNWIKHPLCYTDLTDSSRSGGWGTGRSSWDMSVFSVYRHRIITVDQIGSIPKM